MSDIPLHSIRRNKTRAGYAPIAEDTDSDIVPSSNDTPSMHPTVRAAATSSASRRQMDKSRRTDRYVDDPEEEAMLLGEEASDEETFDGEEPRGVESLVQVGLVNIRPADNSRSCSAHQISY